MLTSVVFTNAKKRLLQINAPKPMRKNEMIDEKVSTDNNIIPFYKNHGFIGEWSNVIESTYDLEKILKYCVSDEMNYTPETKEKIQELIDWLNEATDEGELTDASNLP